MSPSASSERRVGPLAQQISCKLVVAPEDAGQEWGPLVSVTRVYVRFSLLYQAPYHLERIEEARRSQWSHAVLASLLRVSTVLQEDAYHVEPPVRDCVEEGRSAAVIANIDISLSMDGMVWVYVLTKPLKDKEQHM